MKKSLSLILALVMCLSLIPLTAFAAHGNEWIQLEKDNFDPNEIMVITITGITQQMRDTARPEIRIYRKGETNANSYHLDFASVEVGTTQRELKAPAENGEYEIQLHDSGNTYSSKVISILPFTVGPVANQGSISLDKTAYTVHETITVSVSGITEQMAISKAFVGVYEKDAKHESTGNWSYLPAGSSTQTLSVPNKNGEFEVRLYSIEGDYANSFVMSVPFTVSGATEQTDPWGNASGWAAGELKKADELGLIPGVLYGTDFTRPITRAEFAAVSVKLYENLTGNTATPVSPNPFTDTSDPEVLKAFNIGAVNGTSATTFAPDATLTREQMATMLTRVLKSAYIEGWTLDTDAQFTLNFTMPTPFADDALISGYARQSVYFMSANGIIGGTGNNNFSPRAASTSEAAVSIASATREQSLAIAVRMVENLKDKPVDFQQGAVGEQPAATEQPSAPPSSGNNVIVGKWTNEYNGAWRDPDYKPGGFQTTLRGFEFNNDGSFYFYTMTAGWNLVDLVHNGAALYRGKYSVAGDKIAFTNVEEKWIAYDERTTSYDWKASGDLEATYEFLDPELWIDITSWLVSREYYPVQ